MFHATFFHVVETVKVRGMARNIKTGDISRYFHNQVEKKPLISGVVSGCAGALSGSLGFITTFNYLTRWFIERRQYDQLDFRLKNFIIYLASDFVGCNLKLVFEARKQMI